MKNDEFFDNEVSYYRFVGSGLAFFHFDLAKGKRQKAKPDPVPNDPVSAIANRDDDLERLKKYGYKKVALNLVVNAIAAALAIFAFSYISDKFVEIERRLYYLVVFVVAFILGYFVNWLVKVVFHEDISK